MIDLRAVFGIAPALATLSFLLPCDLVRAQSSQVTRLGNFGRGEGEVQAVYAAGTIVYFGVGRELRLANFADPKNPQTISTLELTENIADLAGIEISGQQHLAVIGGSRLFLVNVDNPFAPQSVSSIEVGGTCEGVAVAGTVIHLAAGERGYKIFDLANFSSPLLLAEVDSIAYCESVVLQDSLAGLAAGHGSYLIDISNASQPQCLGKIKAQSGGYHQYVGLREGNAYVCDYNLGLQVYNVSRPTKPQFVASVATGPQATRVVFAENLAYVANGENGVRILDISNPGAPTPLGGLDTPGSAASLFFVAESAPPPPPIVQEEIYNHSALSYLLFRAQNTSALKDGKFPLIISLHGIGERGSNLQRLKATGLPRILDGQNNFPFYVVSPQCPATTEWYYDRTDTLVRKLIDDVLTRYPVDRRRVYLTGYSMGGIGTWDMGIRHSRLFAAAAPIAARRENGWNACAMTGIPVWAFHGEHDEVVPLSAGQRIVSEFQNCGGEIIFTIYPNTGHDAWTKTYANPRLYEWLLSKSK
ncbi:MAG: dienelactone hydrolase family protein [bacterium]